MAEYRRFVAESRSEAKRQMEKEMGLSALLTKRK